jgi:hypothetical protein
VVTVALAMLRDIGFNMDQDGNYFGVLAKNIVLNFTSDGVALSHRGGFIDL